MEGREEFRINRSFGGRHFAATADAVQNLEPGRQSIRRKSRGSPLRTAMSPILHACQAIAVRR